MYFFAKSPEKKALSTKRRDKGTRTRTYLGKYSTKKY